VSGERFCCLRLFFWNLLVRAQSCVPCQLESMQPVRRLIVNADDFGKSGSINAAVIQAHQRGILTTASLMVTGAAGDQAIQLARENPKLGVGLHLTLCCGSSALPQAQIPELVDKDGNFRNSAVAAGMKYFFSTAAREQLKVEIERQFEKFAATGLPLDHVNGHLHFHLHPTVFSIIAANTEKWGIRAMRLTRDPATIDWPLGRGRWLYRGSHALIFWLLSRRSQSVLRARKIAFTRFVFGLLENARATESYALKLLPRLPGGESELYSHPSLDEFRHEFEALISPRVAECVRREGIQLIRYQDLWHDY
jgi:hopanoid biosynthesis associated protein HpnK